MNLTKKISCLPIIIFSISVLVVSLLKIQIVSAAPICYKEIYLENKPYYMKTGDCPKTEFFDANSSKCYITYSSDAAVLSPFDNEDLCIQHMKEKMNYPGARSIPITCPYSDTTGTPNDISKCPYKDGEFGVLNPEYINNGKNPGVTRDNIQGDQAAYESCNTVEGCDFVTKFINPTIKFLTAGVGLIVTAMVIVAGIQYSTAGADPQKVSAARKKIINALIALVTYIFFFAILQWLLPKGLI